MADVVSGVASAVPEVIKRGLFLVVGYFLAKAAVGMLGRFVPQLKAIGEIAVVALGLVLAVFTSGIIQELALGAAIMGTVSVIDSFAGPVLQSTVGRFMG